MQVCKIWTSFRCILFRNKENMFEWKVQFPHWFHVLKCHVEYSEGGAILDIL